MAVMLFDETNKAFYSMCNIENIMQDQISDIRFFEGSLFCISPAQSELCKVRFSNYNYTTAANQRAAAKVSLSTIFDLHINKGYTLTEEASSVFLSRTGLLMYLGVDGFLKAASKSKSGDETYDLQQLSPSHINYISFKEISKQYLAYSDTETNRFYLLDFGMKQIARLQSQGLQTLSPKLFQIKNYHASSHDEHIFLWPMGDTKLGIVDVEAR